jgi:predicted transcriptional regulator
MVMHPGLVLIVLLLVPLVTVPTRFDGAVRVRLEPDLAERLHRIESFLRGPKGRRDVSRSSMIRDAIEAYVGPLISLLDDARDQSDFPILLGLRPVSEEERVGEAARVRLDAHLVQSLDRIEAYARGLRRRDVTRSSMIRAAIAAYLSGFEREIAAGASESEAPDRVNVRAGSAANLEPGSATG